MKWEGGIYNNGTIVLKMTSFIIMMPYVKLKAKVANLWHVISSLTGTYGMLYLV